MRARTALPSLLVCAWVLVALLVPCVAAADVIPAPTDLTPPSTWLTPPTPPIVETASAGTTAGAQAQREADLRRYRGHGQEGSWVLAGLYGIFLFGGSLALTLMVEVPVIVVAGRGSASSWKAAVLVNTLTNPVAVLATVLSAPLLSNASWPLSALIMLGIEAVVFVVEARVLERVLGWSSHKARTTSLVANGLSFGIGLAIIYAIVT